MLETKIIDMETNTIIKRRLLLKTLTKRTPITLNRGIMKLIKIGQKLFKLLNSVKLKSSRFLRQLKKHINVTVTLTVITKNPVDKGFGIRLNDPNSFTRTPMSMRNAMLNPTENKTVSGKSSFVILNNLRRTSPGTNIKKRKPKTCRANGISKIRLIQNAV